MSSPISETEDRRNVIRCICRNEETGNGLLMATLSIQSARHAECTTFRAWVMPSAMLKYMLCARCDLLQLLGYVFTPDTSRCNLLKHPPHVSSKDQVDSNSIGRIVIDKFMAICLPFMSTSFTQFAVKNTHKYAIRCVEWRNQPHRHDAYELLATSWFVNYREREVRFIQLFGRRVRYEIAHKQ